MPTFFWGQESVVQEPSEEEEMMNSSSRLQKEGRFGMINININDVDSIDLHQLDSIISRLDTIINDIQPSSGIYGHEMFKNDSLRIFQPGDIVKIPDSYVVGAGDEIAVSIFGVSQYDARLKVDSSGYVKPDKLPKILLKGVIWSRAQELLKRKYANFFRFRSDQITISLLNPRKITVNIFGEVDQPGSYTLEGTNTAFNALVAAGGPSIKASVRNIIINDGSRQRIFDLYELINDPSARFDFYLNDHSIIQVPYYTKLIAVTGAVKQPMKYELKDNEGLRDVIGYAGGLAANAVLHSIQIKRYQNDQLMLLDVDYRSLVEENGSFPLLDGDQVMVRAVDEYISDYVTVEGAVQVPGDYALSSVPRVSDLVTKSILKREARKDLAFLIRVNPDSTLQLKEVNLSEALNDPRGTNDLQLQTKDRLVVNDLELYVDRSTISVIGAVRQPIEYPFGESARVSLGQVLLLAGGLSSEASDRGYIIRSHPNNRNDKEYVEVDMRAAITSTDPSINVPLQPWDQVVVLDQKEYTDVSTVSIQGAVRLPGAHPYDASLQLRDLIILGGGLKAEASSNIEIFRINIDEEEASITTITVTLDEQYDVVSGPSDFELMPYDEVVVRSVSNFEKQRFVEVRGEVAYPGMYALINDNERLASIITKAGGPTQEAFLEGGHVLRPVFVNNDSLPDDYYQVVTDFSIALRDESSAYNYILKDGDVVVLPKNENIVYIHLDNTNAHDLFAKQYETVRKIAVAYEGGKNAKWYIDHYAGGFGLTADKNNVVVTSASGAMVKSKGGWFKKYPLVTRGSEITVGKHIDFRSDLRKKGEEEQQSNQSLKKGVIINVGKEESVQVEDPN